MMKVSRPGLANLVLTAALCAAGTCHAGFSFSSSNFSYSYSKSSRGPGYSYSYSYSSSSRRPGTAGHVFGAPNGSGSGFGFGSGADQPAGSRYRPLSEPVRIPLAEDLRASTAMPFATVAPAPAAPTTARVETSLSTSEPYVNQPVVYTVQLVSARGATIVDAVVPAADGVAIEELEGPLTETRTGAGGMPEVVNLYRFAITPLQPGTVVIPAFELKGQLVGAQPWYGAPPYGRSTSTEGQPFDLVADAPVRLDVQPPAARVEPWLPLEDLQIEAHLDPLEVIEAGQPLSLTVQLHAVGGSGDALPSIESQLRGEGFRVYRESSRAERTLADDKRTLTGTRMETYTLVPLEGGELHLPDLALAWWNTTTGQVETTRVSLEDLRVAGAAGGASATGAAVASGLKGLFIPLAVFAMAFALYWAWALGRRRGRAQAAGGGAPRSRLRARLDHLRYSLRLGNLRQNLRYRMVAMMPPPMRLWFCSRCIQDESDPADWCQMFKFLACKHLDVPHQTPLEQIADRIVDVHGGARPERVHALIRDLDGAMYGGEKIDFDRWKIRFRKELRPRLFVRRRGRSGTRRGLPDLNPRTS